MATLIELARRQNGAQIGGNVCHVKSPTWRTRVFAIRRTFPEAV